MLDLLKQLIIDFHHESIPEIVARQVGFIDFPANIRKTQVFMGMRRSGKTWVMYQHMHQLLRSNRPKEKLLYLNFEDDRLLSFKPENFQVIIKAYFSLYPHYADDPDVVFYFDEIHIIPGWEKFIRRLLDKEKMGVFVSGSSAKMLSKEIATSLRGRAVSTEIFPFSFKEFLAFYKIPLDFPLNTKNQLVLKHHCNEYLRLGGFPETLFLEKDLHRNLLQEYVNAVVFRDVIERYQISNPYVVKLFLLHCLQNLAASLSVSKVYQSLKSTGAVVGKNSLYDYLRYFEDAYLLFAVPIFNFSPRKRQVNPQKIYTIDPGILSAYSIKPDFDLGLAFENMVFLELRRHYKDIFYYKTNSGKEIDFVVLSETGQVQLFQACFDLKSEQTKIREISALIEAANELKCKNLFIITLDDESEIKQGDFTIRVLPFWKWAMR